MIRFLDLSIDDAEEKKLLTAAFVDHLESGQFIAKDTYSEFEKEMSRRINRKHCVGVNSGTDALIIAIKLLNLPKNSKIITSSFSWIASATSIKLAGHEPVFIGIDESLQIDLGKVCEYIDQAPDRSRIGALLIPHLHGNVTSIAALKKIKTKYGLKVIEDCAQAYKAYDLDGEIAGCVGDVSAFSFNPMKTLGGLGDAGAIVFDKDEYVERAYLLRHSGLAAVNNEVCDELSHNCRIDALQASILLVRSRYLEKKSARRMQLREYYNSYLPKEIESICTNTSGTNNYCMQTLACNSRNELLQWLIDNKIEAKIRHNFLICDQPLFSNSERYKIGDSNKLVERIITLPLHEKMTEKDVVYICDKIKEFYR